MLFFIYCHYKNEHDQTFCPVWSNLNHLTDELRLVQSWNHYF